MTAPAGARAPGADATAGPGAAAALPGRATSGHFLLAAVTAGLLLAMLAGVHVSRPGAADADIHVLADGDVAVVLCVVGADGQARCFA